MVINDFCPITLIGIQYKILAKILAIRLTKVIGSIVSSEQTDFVKNCQILNGPLMVNEVVELYKKN